MPPDDATLRTGSRAAANREPCQVRKEAALSDHRRVPRNGLVRAARHGGHGIRPGRRRVHGNELSLAPDHEEVVTSTVPHQALYRRWRAQTFGEIVGQEAVVETLRNAVRQDRVSHAVLFVGPRGTGKTSLARILAKAVNCTDLQDGDACDRCPSCVSIREGTELGVPGAVQGCPSGGGRRSTWSRWARRAPGASTPSVPCASACRTRPAN